MKPKPIGIVGGAGPLAGVFLLERLFTLSGSLYRCSKDEDFPKVILLSFPFSEMLSPPVDPLQLKKELRDCLDQLRNDGASVLAIACNTLHLFLDEGEDLKNFVHLPELTAAAIPPLEIPLVFCTSTSRLFGLHKRFFPCKYPELDVQLQIDQIIEEILKGTSKEVILQELVKILTLQSEATIVLGCTELSLFASSLQVSDKLIIDPLEILAKKILENSFITDLLK